MGPGEREGEEGEEGRKGGGEEGEGEERDDLFTVINISLGISLSRISLCLLISHDGLYKWI